MDVRITSYTLTSAAGVGIQAHRNAFETQTSGLCSNDFQSSHLDTWIGRVRAADDVSWATKDSEWQSRNNALASVALAEDNFLQYVRDIRSQVAPGRIGVVIGTSTSSIGRTEAAYQRLIDERMPESFRQPHVHNPHSPAAFVAHHCGIDGPQMTISTACSSSAKVFATAARWLDADVVDYVLVGGVDSLCLTVLHGFHALELVSNNRCRPFDRYRDGINLGEAAGFAVLTRPELAEGASVRLAGYGESSDAHHMSHPHPTGLGAELAMRQALERAEVMPSEIGYINLHGTASRANDAIEAIVIDKLFSEQTLASSTKAWTGHTLGAAGVVEALIALDTLASHHVPGTMGLQDLDSDINFPIQKENQKIEVQHVMNNSFGFGGNNCALIFSRVYTGPVT